MSAEVNGNNVAFAVDEGLKYSEPKRRYRRGPELTRISKEYIYGATHLDGKLIVLLELSKVLTVEEQDLLESINSD